MTISLPHSWQPHRKSWQQDGNVWLLPGILQTQGLWLPRGRASVDYHLDRSWVHPETVLCLLIRLIEMGRLAWKMAAPFPGLSRLLLSGSFNTVPASLECIHRFSGRQAGRVLLSRGCSRGHKATHPSWGRVIRREPPLRQWEGERRKGEARRTSQCYEKQQSPAQPLCEPPRDVIRPRWLLNQSLIRRCSWKH